MNRLIKMKIAMLFLSLLSMAAKGESPAELKRISFEEALQLTLQNNYLIKQSGHQLQQMEQEVKAA